MGYGVAQQDLGIKMRLISFVSNNNLLGNG